MNNLTKQAQRLKLEDRIWRLKSEKRSFLPILRDKTPFFQKKRWKSTHQTHFFKMSQNFYITSRRGAAHGRRLESRDKIMGQRAGQRQFLNDWYFLSDRITVDCRLIFTYDVVFDMPTFMSAPACARFNWELLFVQWMSKS